jgi:hypothetical protein
MRRPVEDGLSLLVGAGIGMGLMYLLDPEAGPKRRERLSKTTGELMGQGGSMLGNAWETISETAAAAGHSISDRAHNFADNLDPDDARAAGKRLHKRGLRFYNSASDTVSGTRDNISSRASDLRDRFMSRVQSARKSARGAADRAASSMGYEREHSHIAGQTACALGSKVLGAGLWYLFDPHQGAGRRSWLINKGGRVLRETGTFLRTSGRYVADRMQGAVAEGRTHLMNPPVPDEKLREHIRAKLGHWVNNASAIDVSVMNGRVTLRGTIPSTDIQKVCNGVIGLRGVTNVDNQLMGGNPSQATSMGSTGSIPTAM